MKKILVIALLFSLVIFSAPFAKANVERVQTVESTFWSLLGSYVIDFVCQSGCSGTYTHQMNVSDFDQETGEFSGDGFYITNPSYTWDLMGTLVGTMFNFDIVYTGSNAGYEVTGEGVIAEDGTLSGTSQSSTGQTFEWESTEGTAEEVEVLTNYKNHGQYVSSFEDKEDKKEAAKSRIGMPVQSKGHTKGE